MIDDFQKTYPKYPDCGWSEWRPAPDFNAEMNYVHTGRNRPIRVYHAIDQRFILEDLRN